MAYDTNEKREACVAEAVKESLYRRGCGDGTLTAGFVPRPDPVTLLPDPYHAASTGAPNTLRAICRGVVEGIEGHPSMTSGALKDDATDMAASMLKGEASQPYFNPDNFSSFEHAQYYGQWWGKCAAQFVADINSES